MLILVASKLGWLESYKYTVKIGKQYHFFLDSTVRWRSVLKLPKWYAHILKSQKIQLEIKTISYIYLI